MSDEIAIRICRLGKKYTIGGPREKYLTLRDAIVNIVSTSFQLICHKNFDNPSVYDFWALKDVSFDVHKGEVIGIIGMNGAGKSTLLKILSRITPPTEGIIEVHGRVGSLLEVGTGFHPEMTGRENIFLNGSIIGMKKNEIEAKFDDIVRFAEVEKFLDTPVKRYSSGMYVRLAFAVAAHLDPEILVVDEVLAVGDLRFQEKCLTKMRDFSQENRTVLVVSHNMHLIKRFCTKSILLEGGKIIANGSTDDVIQTYLGRHLLKRLEYSQSSNPEKIMNLLHVRIVDVVGNTSVDINYEDPFFIEITYEVNEEVAHSCVWFGIRTFEDVIAFDSADIDMSEDLLKLRTKGRYVTKIPIPGKWLNAGKFKLVVGVIRYAPTETFDRVECFEFKINEIGTPENVTTGQSRGGLFQPFLKWETQKQ